VPIVPKPKDCNGGTSCGGLRNILDYPAFYGIDFVDFSQVPTGKKMSKQHSLQERIPITVCQSALRLEAFGELGKIIELQTANEHTMLTQDLGVSRKTGASQRVFRC
jgi:hypothetical protein